MQLFLEIEFLDFFWLKINEYKFLKIRENAISNKRDNKILINFYFFGIKCQILLIIFKRMILFISNITEYKSVKNQNKKRKEKRINE